MGVPPWVHLGGPHISPVNEFIAVCGFSRVNSLDYCNSLRYGIGGGLLKKLLQTAQNSASRVVTSTREFDHITPILCVQPSLTSRLTVNTVEARRDHLCGLATSYLADD